MNGKRKLNEKALQRQGGQVQQLIQHRDDFPLGIYRELQSVDCEVLLVIAPHYAVSRTIHVYVDRR